MDKKFGLQCTLMINSVRLLVQFENADAHCCTTADMMNTDTCQELAVWAVSQLPIWFVYSFYNWDHPKRKWIEGFFTYLIWKYLS